MRYEDEKRSRSFITAAKRSQYLADMDKFVADHEVLLLRRKRDASTIQTLQSQLKKAQNSNSRLTAETRSLTDENRVLRSTLSALRRSSRVRVGTAVTAPLRALAHLRTPGKKILQKQRPTDAIPRSGAAQVLQVNPVERLAELRSQAERLPSKGNVYNLLAHQYFVLGAVTEPASLIEQHHAVLTDLTSKERQLIEAVLGLDRLMKQPPVLPPKQGNAGYQPERGRVMYCAHSVSPYNSNGYSTRTTGLIRGLTTAGADIVIAARPGYPWDVKTDKSPPSNHSYTEDIAGVPHFFSQGPSWTQSPLDHYLQQAADSYVQIAIRNRVERIQAASNHVTALPALIAARRLGLPFVYEVRGLWEITEASTKPDWNRSDRFNFSQTMETLVAAEADAVFAITAQVRDELVRRGVPAAKISILPNAVDTNEFSDMPPHGATRTRLGLDGDVPVVGYAGSLVAYEGLGTLLDAIKVLVSKEIDVRMVIVGDGAALPQLKAYATALGISDFVIFTGRIPADDIPALISVFDIMPCPRLPLPVTEMVSPLKPLEAMAAAKAVVLSDLAPLRDLAGDDGERARLFSAGNADELAEVLEELIQDPDQRLAMGRRARLWTVAERTWNGVGSAARRAHISLPRAIPPFERNLSDLRIGIIADEFTVAGLQPETSLVELHPAEWENQIAAARIDAVFVESAWDGNGGSWRGKVGYYDEDSFADLRALLAFCRARSIPTIFWNKEDPVHFNRFRETAKQFDHVFTSDDGSIRGYLDSGGAFLKSVASLPFYAQPALHNPLRGTRAYSHTVSYAGSYYGDRYKIRSEQLQFILGAARPSGLTIFDRQHLNPDSPYRFPPELAAHVEGGLTYEEMVDAYKAHPVHVNVNSVDQSGTMFSRRVFEVAACGGAIVSGPGRGVDQMFGGIIPVVTDRSSAAALITYWMESETARNDDAWLALRAVLRAHTAAHRLTYVLRTAGLQIRAPELEKYAVVVRELTSELCDQLVRQSVLPSLVLVETGPVPTAGAASFPVVRYDSLNPPDLEALGITLQGRVDRPTLDRTYFEDLLSSRKYCAWERAAIDPAGADTRGQGLAYFSDLAPAAPGLRTLEATDGSPTMILNRNLSGTATLASKSGPHERNVLVAGHDLKFAGGIISSLRDDGHNVTLDQWLGHAQHDDQQSLELLAQADTIFCEWTLGNAVWFADRKRPDQRLVCRLHLQELDTPYLRQLNTANVDLFIFVGAHIAELAQRDFGIPKSRSVVIPNYVDVDALQLPKTSDARWNLGLVGIVPQRKRLDLALDVLKGLRTKEPRYSLFIKGKRAEDFPWMAERTDELSYYLDQYRRIDADPLLRDAVTFDTHGDDMASWYQKIGTVLSVSDFESFHLTLADGAASGALSASLAWPGADQIYPASWIKAEPKELTKHILDKTASSEEWAMAGGQAQTYVREQFSDLIVLDHLKQTILGS